jgi:hypothetical protein
MPWDELLEAVVDGSRLENILGEELLGQLVSGSKHRGRAISR